MTVKLPPRRLWTAGSQAAQKLAPRPTPVYKCPLCKDAQWVIDPARNLTDRSGNAVATITTFRCTFSLDF